MTSAAAVRTRQPTFPAARRSHAKIIRAAADATIATAAEVAISQGFHRMVGDISSAAMPM